MRRGLPLLALLLFTALAPAESPTACHGWYQSPDAGRLDLYWRGEKIGMLDPLTANWQTEGKAHQVDLVATFGLSRPRPAIGDDPFPGGVQADKIPPVGAPTYQINGQPADKQAALRKLDDSYQERRGEGEKGRRGEGEKHFLTAVLPDAPRQQFLNDINAHPALRAWRGKLHINAYAPTDWHVGQIGLAEGITYQGAADAQGRALVRFRLRTYAGPDCAAQLAEALRKADGGYKPDSDPDPAKLPSPTPGPPASPILDGIDVDQTSQWGATGAALLSLLLSLRRRYAV
jgi:hypothetical protein